MSTFTKKTLTWNKTHDSLYDMLYGRYIKFNPIIDYGTFIEDNASPKSRTGILSFIMNKTDYAEGTKKNLIYMCARWLEIRNNQLHKIYAQKGHELRAQIEDDEANNNQSTKETAHYRDHSYFLQLIEEYKPTAHLMTYKEHIQFLILCMVVLQPPVRTSYYISAQFIKQKKQDDGLNNCIFLNAKNPRSASYIINDDKVTKSLYYKTRKELKTIVIEDDYLTDLLFQSYKKYPRTYLLQKLPMDNDVITQATYLRWLRTVTGIEGVDNDMMRSSYVTWFYHNGHPSHKQKEELAHKMRHSVTSASKYYDKKFDPVESDESVDRNAHGPSELISKNAILTDRLEQCGEQKINVKHFTKLRYDVLYRLNNFSNLKPRQSTIDKYNLEYNLVEKIWF